MVNNTTGRAQVSSYAQEKMKTLDVKLWNSEIEEFSGIDLSARFSSRGPQGGGTCMRKMYGISLYRWGKRQKRISSTAEHADMKVCVGACHRN